MTISEATPIQFWDEDDETFNEKEICSVARACFYLPFDCDDTINIPFEDAGIYEWELNILDKNGDILDVIPFEKSGSVYKLAWTPSISSPPTCEDVRFIIVRLTPIIRNPSFNSSFTGSWYNFGSGDTWSWTGSEAEAGGSSFDSAALTQDFGQTYPIGSYKLVLDAVTFGFGNIQYTVRTFLNSTLAQDLFSGDINAVTEGDDVQVVYFTATAPFNRIRINAGTGTSVDTWIAGIFLYKLDDLKKSDVVSLKDTQDCTTLIRYSNSKNFADINYQTSPPPTFNIRIPAIFNQERFPDEHEETDLSNSRIVRQTNQIKAQRLLEIGFMPFYMHKKLQLILAHDTIEIDGEEWIKTEPYEITDGNKRYPLRKAQVWLTNKNYIVRNIL